MRYATSREQRDFFFKNGFIEFEGLLTEEEREAALEAVHLALKKRGGALHFESGRDLWRVAPEVKKLSAKRRLAEIISELTGCRPIKLGCDQLLAPKGLPWQECSLEEIAPFQGAAGGALICLKGEEEPEEPSPFPGKAGNVTLFNKECLIDFTEVQKKEGALFLLVCYTEKSALYILQKNDPLTHSLKHFGYAFGDRLKEEFHPTLCK